MKEVTDEKLDKYFSITQAALKKIKFVAEKEKDAEIIFDMASRYFSDAKHFRSKGDYLTAFAALNYAHGWLDCGARLGYFDVNHDSTLFTVD